MMPAFEPGARIGPFDSSIDADFVRRYALATGDGHPLYSAAAAVPPCAIATRIFEAQLAATESLAGDMLRAARGGVHGEHDLVLHRPVRVGEPLTTVVEAHSVRPSRHHVRLVLRHLTTDAAGRPVAEQLWTTVLMGVTAGAAGPDAPGHRFPEEARARPAGALSVRIDGSMARAYAEVSGDFSAHHFDAEAARRSGFDSVFLHGLCTLGLCTRAAVDGPAGGDPRRLRRVAVRFAGPAILDTDLEIRIYAAGAGAYALEAAGAGAPVITDGRVELAPT